MTRGLAAAVCGLLCLGGEGRGADDVARVAGKLGWLTDYQAARSVARRQGKPLLVVFRCQP